MWATGNSRGSVLLGQRRPISRTLALPTPSAAEYVHRVGRTARLEASGKALMLLLPKEEDFIDILQQHDLTCVGQVTLVSPAPFIRPSASLSLGRATILRQYQSRAADEAARPHGAEKSRRR